MISKIEKVPPRELWEKETKDFESWLEKNIDYLNEQTGLRISITGREKHVGDFLIDLVGEDENGMVVIENQLEPTDHDHLGKILTYLAMAGAKTAIWIASKPRDEHIKVIEWLNDTAPVDYSFYLIKIEAIRIDHSPPAPLFSLVAGPKAVVKAIGKEKRILAKRHYERKEFWTGLLNRAKEKTDLFNNITPKFDHWLGIGGGRSGIAFNFIILKDRGACEIYLDRGKGFDKLNKERFNHLFNHKNEIERKIGRKLIWECLDNRRASRIKIEFCGVGLRDREKWQEIQDKMISAMVRLYKIFQPRIREMKR